MQPLAITLLALSTGLSFAATYQDEVAFLKKHTDIVELESGQARVAIAPAWQGRVMTTSAEGPDGAGFGWINPGVIEAGIKPEAERSGLARHIHVFGGEERLWFGPEGGPFALFFPPKVEQTFANWKTPAAMDTEPFELAASAPDHATFVKSIHLVNRAGTEFSIDVRRTVAITGASELAKICGGPLDGGVHAVAYTSSNTVKNTGGSGWTRDSGAPSVWMLGMFKPTPGTTIVIPFQTGDDALLGPVAHTGYFGEIPPSRIQFGDGVLFFKGDGRERGKIGIPPKRAKGLAGSWQADTGTLTLLLIGSREDAAHTGWPYVDSQWREDVDPFDGDSLNSYNDGPPEPGAKPLGPFYELETSSPALFLKPGESFTHCQSTVHLTGSRQALDAIAKRTLGVGLDAIEGALP